jgi:hypothetical protein
MDAIVATPSMTDPPFAVPADIVLDLPAPPSVNKVRRVDWSSVRVVKAWQNVSNAYVLAAKGRAISPLRLTKIPKFEDDSPKHMRRLVVEWGLAPFGCRVTVKPCL